MAKGMTVQIVDRYGKAVRRKWFLTVAAAEAWLNWQYPNRNRLGYEIEIFYD